MDDQRVGSVFRAVRLRRGLRQVDVAKAAGVSQAQVSRLEQGAIDQLLTRTVRAIGAVLGIAVRLMPQWRGADLHQLLDAGHAELVEAVVAELKRLGWGCELEYGFNHFGERGSVDILAWFPPAGALLLVEVKTRLVDLQDLFASLARKTRLVPAIFSRAADRPVALTGCLLVAADTSTNRRVVQAHASSFDVVLPARGVEVHRWLRQPVGDLRGVRFLSPIRGWNGIQASAGRSGARRVRKHSGGMSPRVSGVAAGMAGRQVSSKSALRAAGRQLTQDIHPAVATGGRSRLG